MRKLLLFLSAIVVSMMISAQDRPDPQPAADTYEKFKVGMAGYTFVNFDLDKTLQTLEKCDVHYLCIKDFHLPFNITTSYNIVLAIGGLNGFVSTEVQNSTSVLRLKFSAKNPAHRQYAARYLQA